MTRQSEEGEVDKYGQQGSLDITRAGCKGIAGLSPEVLAPRGVLSDGAGGTLRGPPA
jgi:hypothetical protein